MADSPPDPPKHRLVELEQPKRALRALSDRRRCAAFAEAVARAAPGRRVLVLEGATAGLLPVLCARAGAAAVTGARVRPNAWQ